MSASAYERIRQLVIEEVENQGLDPDADAAAIASVAAATVDRYQRHADGGSELHRLRDPGGMTERVIESIAAFGPVTALLADGDLEEIFIEGDRVTFLDGTGRLRSLPDPITVPETEHLVARLLAGTDRRLDASSPVVQARVLDGTARLTAVIPPVSDRISATLRRYALRRDSLSHLVELGSLSRAAGDFLAAAMQASTSVLVSGPPGAGKTSLLAALLAAAPPAHCVRCVEEVRELNVALGPHSSCYEARPPGVDDRSEVTLRDLVKLVLAMRPDRIVVGEVRGPEAFELTRASNAGCGFCATVHANSARDALEALVNAALMAGENVTEHVVRKVFGSSIDLLVHLDRDAVAREERGPRRRTMEILAVQPSFGDDFATEPIFTRESLGAELAWSGALPPAALVARIEDAAGVSLRAICDGSPR